MIVTDKIKLYLLAGALAVGVLALAGAGMKIATLRVKLATSQTETETARGLLSSRIAAEALAVSTAIQKARAEEQTSAAQLQEKFDELKKSSAADAANLGAARERLRILAAGSAARPGSSDVPSAAAAADRVADASADGLRDEDRVIIDGLLQLAAEAAESARQRNFTVNQYQVNCRRDAPR